MNFWIAIFGIIAASAVVYLALSLNRKDDETCEEDAHAAHGHH